MKNFRLNQLGIQMIPEFLHRKLFGRRTTNFKNNVDLNMVVKQLKKSIGNIELNSKDLLQSLINHPWESAVKYLPDLLNHDVVDHINYLGQCYSEPYLNSVDKLLSIPEEILKSRPKKWNLSPGWTRYQVENNLFDKVEYPIEDSLVFDVEVLMEKSNNNRPTLAVALSPEAWYSWCSESLAEVKNETVLNSGFEYVRENTLQDMISMGHFGDQVRLIVGHNVSFDRSFIKEQYLIENDRTRFLDTMSLHICVAGLNQEQKILAMRNRNPWEEISSLNNLSDVYKLYCKSEHGLSKDPRNIFLKGTLQDVRKDFNNLMNYCANDVRATFDVFRSLFPQFVERFPNPVTLAGMLEMSIMYLPVNQNVWKRYLNESHSIFNQYKNEINKTLKEIACDACSALNGEIYKSDPWLWDLDWKTRSLGYKKSFREISYENLNKNDLVSSLMETSKHLKKNQPNLPGYPQWFVELCSNSKFLNKFDSIDFNEVFDFDQFNITTKMRTIPKLLRLMWMGYPLYFDQTNGWGYLVPLPTSENCDKSFETLRTIRSICLDRTLEEKDIATGLHNIVPGCLFFKLPHKNGPNKRVGNPLSKDFMEKISDGTLQPYTSSMDDLVRTQNKISYWINSSKRILSQMVLSYDQNGDGSILPRVVVCGTVTRRAVEPTWLTASNSYPDRLGSELKGIIQCPAGYSYVGADVDSQELWIASLIGDAHFCGVQGSTGLGWMNLKGEKSKQTDVHSVTAKTINITRDEAKVLNYARVYGSGQEFASRFLKRSNPNLSDEEAKLKAKKMFCQTKGYRQRVIKQIGDETVIEREWVGGTESHMFNKLERIATASNPRTPFLKGRISRALEPMAVGNDYITSRINWVVQSSAVDFLHILLVCMKWMMECFKIKGRFSISIHDEIRYIIENDHKYRAALALQFSNLLARSYFTAILKLDDLPASVAFFSSIEIDKCLRKDAKDDCKTPSNALGLSKGYGIPPGETLDIVRLLTIIESDQEFQEQFVSDQSSRQQQISQ
ncbi:DNA polymerase subunit gamma-1 [Sarcoptes scabiei]|uniref:DNA-directed DNA polymerase n=1 Tax=Sarcoptes scabiei TaxID=52283 RepID=A0A131ZTF2_SARSC|nr:DNA polymerase subunit gamma-1 [Sarcoptes scabiei]KPM01601.1 DNA polymerase subunit gamma-1-like protein [Sarcoptes scabiei]